MFLHSDSGRLGFIPVSQMEVVMDFDPQPDYDGTDEIEYFFSWLPWALRGTDWTGTPSYPPV